jgi:5'(3')-deoxyribonucleotidase
MKHKIQIIDNFLDEPLHYKNLQSLDTTQEISNKIAHILQSNVYIIPAAINTAPSQITSEGVVDYIAILYLDFPTECVNKKAVSFWMHKETQDEELPNPTKMKWMGLHTIEEIDVFKKETWERYMEYFVKYNRLILFDARMFHSYGDESDCRKFNVEINK